jgi:serine/threonine protein kinase
MRSTSTHRTVGNYTLGPLLGRGGAGEVYAGEHRVFGDAIAIKLLRTELADDEATASAFIAEAINARGLDHPNIVRVLDAGRDPETGRCYLVMHRVQGETLSKQLARDGRLGEPEVRRLGAAIADGLAAAHASGIVHRDIKPGNVMVHAGQPTIVDFGIAKSLGRAPATVTERRIGTPAYMAPEQLAEGLISPAVDVWALGVVLFEAATGRLPFQNFADGRCPALVEDAPRARAFAQISPALDAVIARCLARSPAHRPSAGDVARALRGEPLDDRVTEDLGPTNPMPPAPRRGRWIVPVAGAALALLLAGVGIALALARDEDPPSQVSDTRMGPVPSSSPDTPDAREPTSDPIPDAVPDKPDGLVDVMVRSEPPGAAVAIAGVTRGMTPQKLQVPRGTVIVVRRAGYRPARVRVKEAGDVAVKLQRVPKIKTTTQTNTQTNTKTNTTTGETLD